MKKQFFLVAIMLICSVVAAQESYKLGPNSLYYKGIPAGTITHHSWESKIYPNTTRDYAVYVPSHYHESRPAALMVFQDGHTYLKEDGHFRVPVVFNNLISQGKMPVTIGLFINPGHDLSLDSPESPWRSNNRSVEYDEVSDTYVRFLTEELIPELKKSYNISDDPKMRAICGLSSGGICAFSAAWFRPDQFHKVLSHIGSFTDIRGGHNYPSMIRKSDKKDIKVFLQDGKNDLDNRAGNWWLANLQMEAALKFKGYDYKFVPGTGGHDGIQGGAILPESLTWLWSDVVVQKVPSGVYALSDDQQEGLLLSGESMHLSDIRFEIKTLSQQEGIRDLFNKELEQILIIKEGKVEVNVAEETQIIGPNSVAFLLPGEKGTITSKSERTSYYTMLYTSAYNPNLERGKEDGGSFIIDYDQLEYLKHDKGGRRNFFRRSTAMCPYYEMHITNLNPGIKSHEPHIHRAAEFIIMIDGDTEMEIGNELYKAEKGGVYFAPAYVPHAIRNTGDKQCQYFAFQWH